MSVTGLVVGTVYYMAEPDLGGMHQIIVTDVLTRRVMFELPTCKILIVGGSPDRDHDASAVISAAAARSMPAIHQF